MHLDKCDKCMHLWLHTHLYTALVYWTCMHLNCMAFKCAELNAMHLWSFLYTSLAFNTSEVNGLELYELHLHAPDSAVHVQSTRSYEREDKNI